MYKIAFATLGCKVNQYDTDAMIMTFKNNGYEIVDFKDKADVYVVNTCTVTATGDKKSRQILRRAALANPDAIVVATGCYAQSSPEEVKGILGVDIVTGTASRAKLLEIVNEKLTKAEDDKAFEIEDVAFCRNYEEMGTEGFFERARAYVKIQDGCDSFCTYCRVPYVRGRVRSRNLEAILEEVNNLALKGIKEVVLTGIHLSLYGKDFKFDPDLADVLEKISEIQGIKRIRLSSVDPADMTDKLIKVITGSDKICKHLHMSLQSGDNGILKRMNRSYTREKFAETVDKIRSLAPEVAFTTDVIVGFPGEDEKAFENTLDLVRKIGFSKVHTFKYSKRKGTKAADFEDQISSAEKEDRSQKLITLSNELGLEHNLKKIGRTDYVLIERVYDSYKEITELKSLSEDDLPSQSKFAEGVTDDYTRAFFEIEEGTKVDDIVEMKVTKAYPEYVLGKMLEVQKILRGAQPL